MAKERKRSTDDDLPGVPAKAGAPADLPGVPAMAPAPGRDPALPIRAPDGTGIPDAGGPRPGGADDSAAEAGRIRVVVERVTPQIDGGRFPIKRTVGERVTVEASVFADGHDSIVGMLLYRAESAAAWTEAEMEFLGNDRWRAQFAVAAIGRWLYTVSGWVDPFKTWRRDLEKRVEARQDVALELLAGAGLVRQAGERARLAGRKSDGRVLAGLARALEQAKDGTARLRLALDPELAQLMDRYPDRRHAGSFDRELAVVVDRERARFSAWYEMFPRSCSPEPGRHGTFRDCADRLAYVAGMGFDVLYLPPIHPIGRTHRKGKKNSPVAGADDVGSPWAIGAEEGGHKAILPQLGTEEDFRGLIARAREHGMEVALDIAFQCSPDHPYGKEHPEWFRKRPDGTIQYAENPPKKYEDIYPFDFECDAWRELWLELKSIFDHWIGFGIHIFRVDNPHTKPFAFWEWLIGEIKREHPQVIFLSEAFTRPHLMYRLAKLGFTQSYNYFPWRNNRRELTEYFTELTRTEVAEFFRPSLWPNTPDILTEYLQFGGRPGFMVRLILAATLGASYGIYGPAFELLEHEPREPGGEEYRDSEKYQLRHWDLDASYSLRDLIALVNRARRDNPALQSDAGLRFHSTDNDQLMCYSKAVPDHDSAVVVVVNLDPHHTQSGWVELAPQDLGLDGGRPFQVHDLLTGARYLWHGPRSFVQLDPRQVPAHLFRVRRRVRSERDFDYFQ
ncbi:MAG TPA: alpha-1,4-glucan--maltose-1-phosphate maltosyltransferase [Thermoanaerobaculia bacterium]|nr:alpha-1,4-glucan--maltose-1-phosphate maltosyltransferase [Thermoanaerobaculia bacterium]